MCGIICARPSDQRSRLGSSSWVCALNAACNDIISAALPQNESTVTLRLQFSRSGALPIQPIEYRGRAGQMDALKLGACMRVGHCGSVGKDQKVKDDEWSKLFNIRHSTMRSMAACVNWLSRMPTFFMFIYMT